MTDTKQNMAAVIDEYKAMLTAAQEQIAKLQDALASERTLRIAVHDEWQDAEDDLAAANARIAELEKGA